jgi:hypothetical protein
MSNGREFGKPAAYRIKVKGTLGEKWSDWFGGFKITALPGDETLMTGVVTDQPALHGLLAKVRDLGLPLLLLERLGPEVEE